MSDAGKRTARVAYVDAPAGCSGDMFLGALVDAGLSLAVLEEVVDGLGLEGVEVRASHVERGALTATKVDVCRGGEPIAGRDDVHLQAEGEAHSHSHSTLPSILHAIGHLGDIETVPYSRAAATFRCLAEAEARVHGKPVDEVHFHEVGAADALVDVVGTCVGFHHLGVESILVSPLPWGRGTVETAHGTLPLPAPATAFLLEGHPVVPSEATYEQVTPTGAALVKALVDGHRMPHGFVPQRIGIGAGAKDTQGLPNVLRLVLGEVQALGERDDAMLLETNLDDVSGQVTARALEQALSAGALDAWWTAIGMKKGRPGVLLSVLARREDAARLEAVLFRETPTLGVRRRPVERSVLPRRLEQVSTPWGSVRIKVRAGSDGERGTPEYEDCRKLAEAHGIPVGEIIEIASQRWRDA